MKHVYKILQPYIVKRATRELVQPSSYALHRQPTSYIYGFFFNFLTYYQTITPFYIFFYYGPDTNGNNTGILLNEISIYEFLQLFVGNGTKR